MLYNIETIYKNTYRLDEGGRANCYLVVGEEKALLIDSCWGLGNLKEVVESLTDKPVITAATHRHPDHTGGFRQFDGFYASPKDDTPGNRNSEKPWVSMLMVRMRKQKIQPFHKKKMGPVLPLQDGDTFDLGGRVIEVRAIPGHTAGSVMFLEHETKQMFTGDDVNPRLWMQGPGATTLEEWKIGAQQVLDLMDEGYTAWIGHLDGRQPKERLLQVYALVEEIIRKKKEGTLTKKDSPYPQKEAFPEVRFRLDNIL